jgi:hypothetical protein
MSHLQVRRIPFTFEGVDFIWNPSNPGFSILMNVISFMVIGLEKYMCLAMRDAEPLIKNPAILEEARLFRAQESVHSQAHRKHVNALVARYPGLAPALDKAIAHYDELYASRDLRYHLAYAGGLEASFTPFFKMILDNRDTLFGGGDARVASLFVWHFCEEIEHRSSALAIYNEVVGDSWYRVRNVKSFYSHGGACAAMLMSEFRIQVMEIPESYYREPAFATVPRMQKLRSGLGIVNSQLPWHNPMHQPLPNYYDEWSRRYESGENMSNFYGSSAQAAT